MTMFGEIYVRNITILLRIRGVTIGLTRSYYYLMFILTPMFPFSQTSLEESC